MGNQRQLNGGKQGSGSGLDADLIDGLSPSQLDVDKVDGKEASELGGISGESGNERVEYGTVTSISNIDSDGGYTSQSFAVAYNTAPVINGITPIGDADEPISVVAGVYKNDGSVNYSRSTRVTSTTLYMAFHPVDGSGGSTINVNWSVIGE